LFDIILEDKVIESWQYYINTHHYSDHKRIEEQLRKESDNETIEKIVLNIKGEV